MTLQGARFAPSLLQIAPCLASKPKLSATARHFSTPRMSALSPGGPPVEFSTGLPDAPY